MYSWTLWFITKEKCAESSIFLNLFLHAPFFMRDHGRWYFPGLCALSETTTGHSRQASVTTSLRFPYSRRVMIVLRRPLHSVVSDGHVFGLFVPLPPAVLIGCTKEANISLEAAVVQNCFSVLCSSGHSRYQSPLIPVPPPIRPK